jgi:hypothetical protein
MEHTIERKEWTAPEAVCYGTVSDITRQIKPKGPGSEDDLADNVSTFI